MPVRKPIVRNPFPQLSRVAVAPFINLSSEPSVDGRRFALAYYNELQATPGFEVAPIGVVENAMRTFRIELANPGEARRLAQILGVDAVVVGAVTDFSPYYPPRLGLRVEWYAANPFFHPIPPGYGLPLDEPEEEDLPESLLYEASLARARYELETHTPQAPAVPLPVPPLPGEAIPPPEILEDSASRQEPIDSSDGAAFVGPIATVATAPAVQVSVTAGNVVKPPSQSALTAMPAVPLDDRLLNSAHTPHPVPSDEPVLRHTRVYNGHDEWFTEALRTYHMFREDQRDGSWEDYLQRSEDFIRFCCHLHISEMLAARGGAAASPLVFRRPRGR